MKLPEVLRYKSLEELSEAEYAAGIRRTSELLRIFFHCVLMLIFLYLVP
jgi:hypothetical protein